MYVQLFLDDMGLPQSTTALTTIPSSTTSSISKTRTLPIWMLQTESSSPKKKPKQTKKATKERGVRVCVVFMKANESHKA